MRNSYAKAASGAACFLIASVGMGTAAPLPGDSAPALPFPPGFFHRGPDATDPRLRPIVPGQPSDFERPGQPGSGSDEGADGPASVGRGMGDEAPPEPAPKPPTRAEMLDRLFGRLAKATDPDEAQGIAGRVEAIWMRSGSPTADLLMSRAVTASNHNRRDVAEALLDKIIELDPGWAEGWNMRATMRFLDGDDAGSMEDIGHVLSLEPRHFGALAGMGTILERHGEDRAALTALRRALALYPENPELRKTVDKLVPEVEGRDL